MWDSFFLLAFRLFILCVQVLPNPLQKPIGCNENMVSVALGSIYSLGNIPSRIARSWAFVRPYNYLAEGGTGPLFHSRQRSTSSTELCLRKELPGILSSIFACQTFMPTTAFCSLPRRLTILPPLISNSYAKR